MQPGPSLIQRMFDQAFNLGNLAIVDDLVTAGSITHTVSWGLPASRMGLKQLIANLRIAFPDLHCIVDDEIFASDKNAAHWTMRGTHTGSLFGNPPTGRRIDVQGIIFTRAENGRIVDTWILIDQFGMLQQLGVVPPPKGHLERIEER